jgi:hypothetical protein
MYMWEFYYSVLFHWYVQSALISYRSQELFPFLPVILLTATLLHLLFFLPPSLHLAIYSLVYLLVLLFPNSHAIHFWEFYFLPFSVYSYMSIHICCFFFWMFVCLANDCGTFCRQQSAMWWSSWREVPLIPCCKSWSDCLRQRQGSTQRKLSWQLAFCTIVTLCMGKQISII